MSQTGIKAFDTTINTTNIWLNDIAAEMNWDDRQRAYHALRAVFHTLRDHLPVSEVVSFGAQLPMLVRGVYYEGWHPADKPVRDRKKEDFLAPIQAAFPDDPDTTAEDATRAVFRVVGRHVTAGEVNHVRHALPRPIQELWD